MFWNIVTTECPGRSVRRLRNILRTECYVVPALPPEGPQNQQVRQGSPPVTAAGRRLPRAAVDPSTQHIPTTVQTRRARMPEGKSRKARRPEGVRARRPASSSVSSVSRPCGRSGSRRCAVWTLAAWRCLILHARLGLRRSTVEWSAIHRVPAPHLFPVSGSAPCALTPRG